MSDFIPEETAFESRLFEALLREGLDKNDIKRQLKISCKCQDSSCHSKGYPWNVDFYIKPFLVVEVDGHTVNYDRDRCVGNRGIAIYHVFNQSLMSMPKARSVAFDVIRIRSAIITFANGIKSGDRYAITTGALTLSEEIRITESSIFHLHRRLKERYGA